MYRVTVDSGHTFAINGIIINDNVNINNIKKYKSSTTNNNFDAKNKSDIKSVV